MGLLALCASVSICACAISAQEVSLERGKGHDPVARIFDAAKNETIVSVVPNFTATLAAQILAGSPDVQRDPRHESIDFTLRAISYSYPGNVPLRPQTVKFVFVSDGRKPKYKDTTEFRIDVDGSPVTQGKIDYDVKDSSFGKVEVLMALVPTDLFLRIARAAKVQFSFGAKTHKLSNLQKKDLRALAETIP